MTPSAYQSLSKADKRLYQSQVAIAVKSNWSLVDASRSRLSRDKVGEFVEALVPICLATPHRVKPCQVVFETLITSSIESDTFQVMQLHTLSNPAKEIFWQFGKGLPTTVAADAATTAASPLSFEACVLARQDSLLWKAFARCRGLGKGQSKNTKSKNTRQKGA